MPSFDAIEDRVYFARTPAEPSRDTTCYSGAVGIDWRFVPFYISPRDEDGTTGRPDHLFANKAFHRVVANFRRPGRFYVSIFDLFAVIVCVRKTDNGKDMKQGIMKKVKDGGKGGKVASSSRLIDARIKELGDWRGEMLARIRALIKQADPEVVEEWKWRGVPVWSHAGIICTGETYKTVVKMTFAKGASLDDPSGLFNSSLEGNTRRAIDLREGDGINEKALKALIRAASALNTSTRAAARLVRSQKSAKGA